MNVNLHIERLVLDGLPHGVDGNAVRAELESRLADLLAQGATQGAWTQGTAVPALRGATVAPPSTRSEGFGEAVAKSVYGAITR